MKDMRRGKFSITEIFIESAPEVVRQIMGRVIVVGLKCYIGGVIEYEAISPEFDILKQEEMIPEYRVEIEGKWGQDKRILSKIIFKRVK